jgi:CRISPR-associated protein Csd1
MIKELSDLGKKLRNEKKENEWVHDALKEETISLVLTINQSGSFISLRSIDKKKTVAEAIQRTSGKSARQLIDNCGYVLGVYDNEGVSYKKKVKEKGEKKAEEIFKKDTAGKLKEFIDRLNELEDLEEIQPVIKFYFGNKQNGIDVINQSYFISEITKKERNGNIAILVVDQEMFVHEYENVYKRIIDTYVTKQQKINTTVKNKCSVCGSSNYPVGDFTHFPIRAVPGDKEPAGGRKLISYNGDNNPFESYGMIGNENCMICTNCAKTYTEGLNWLMTNGHEIPVTNKKGNNVNEFRYTNRKSFGHDTAIVFWTRENQLLKDLDILDMPTEADVASLFDTVTSGDVKSIENSKVDQFYTCTLSGTAARIAVRDWFETSFADFRKSLLQWFKDIAVVEYKFELKRYQIQYSRLYNMARSCQNENDEKNPTLARVACHLWNAALKNIALPLWILTAVLKRIQVDGKGVSSDRAALIRILLNRNNKGGYMIQEKLDPENAGTAYNSGRIFAVLESVQRAALGKNINAGVRERFFTSASTTPASAFGRLLKNSQNHLSKLKSEKPGLAVVLDKELTEIIAKIETFPVVFSLEEQGQFAIGYYHQKNNQFNKPELKEIVESEEAQHE